MPPMTTNLDAGSILAGKRLPHTATTIIIHMMQQIHAATVILYYITFFSLLWNHHKAICAGHFYEEVIFFSLSPQLPLTP